MTLMHFQYITELYAERADRRDIKWRIEKWLLEHVGREGTAREPFMDFGWAWSLSVYDSGGSPNGIYFVREEDKVVFRLAFGLGYGRL